MDMYALVFYCITFSIIVFVTIASYFSKRLSDTVRIEDFETATGLLFFGLIPVINVVIAFIIISLLICSIFKGLTEHFDRKLTKKKHHWSRK